jgi:hypothetical protein
MLEWREREHEMEDQITGNDPNTMLALQRCGLEKFFQIHDMRAQVRLLEFLVKMWEPNEQVFKVKVHDLALETEDIYFLTGLSRMRRVSVFVLDSWEVVKRPRIISHNIVLPE